MRLIYRTKILLSLLQELGGQLSNTRMQLLLFLYCKACIKQNAYYDFIPLNGSPHSLQAEEDRKTLIRKKILEPSPNWTLATTSKRFATELDFFEKMALQDLKSNYSTQSNETLASEITNNYPYDMRNPSAKNAAKTLYTIGYEGLSPEAYINLLLKNGVLLLVDVRKNAFSKKYGFSKSELAQTLPQVNIEYLHMPTLGIASNKRQTLTTDKDYTILFQEYDQTTLPREQASLDLLQQLLKEKSNIAITCFEADPYHCHRSRITQALKNRETFTYKIKHLHICNHTSPHK